MFHTLANAFKIKDVRRKILITIALLFVYRLGCYIPVPGIETLNKNVFEGYTFLQIMSGVSGGALANGTFFAMGIGPYINSSIIVQLLTVGIPALERWSKQGEEGKRKINNVTRIITLILAIVQAVGIILVFRNSNTLNLSKLFGDNFFSYLFLVMIFTAGACLTMWIGERITDYGVSNGISLLIFAGILSTAGTSILGMIGNVFNPTTVETSQDAIWQLVGFLVVALLIFAAIVTVNSAERKIPVQYAKQVKGRKMYGGQSTHIPIKVNASGVMPLIFSFSILSFPDLILSLLGYGETWWQRNMGSGSWFYMILLCLLILFFSYFYNKIQFNPEDISKSIQGNGGFIPGTRPGKPTADYLTRISNRITLFGAIFLALVALVPTIVFKAIDPNGVNGLVNVFSATGLLIIVSVALEFEQALQSQIMMKNYKGFLK